MTKKAAPSIYEIKINDLKGDTVDLEDFRGKKILFVNVASKCGFTPQYKLLQKLHDKHGDAVTVIGVPCNQFGRQEPGNSDDIASFCEINYGVTFLITEKIDVKGANQHPLYQWLTDKDLNGKKSTKVKWNFQKYLVDDNGAFIDYYYSVTRPTSPRIVSHLK